MNDYYVKQKENEKEAMDKKKTKIHNFIHDAIKECEKQKDDRPSYEKTEQSLKGFINALEEVERSRDEYQRQADSLISLNVKTHQVQEGISDIHQNETGLFGQSVSNKKNTSIQKPLYKEQNDYLESYKKQFDLAVSNLERFLVSKDNHGITKDNKGNFKWGNNIATVIGDHFGEKFDSFERRESLAKDALNDYIKNITSDVRKNTYEYLIQEDQEKKRELETQDTDKIRHNIAFYESDEFHGVRVVVHGKHLLEKMTERERLISSIDRALDDAFVLEGFEETRKTLEEIKRQEEKNFEKERANFEKESGYQDMVQAIEKDKAIEQYANLIREKNAAGSEITEQDLAKLQETLGLTTSEVSEAERRVEREIEDKKADEQIEKSEQMAKEAAKNERIDREIRADELGKEAVSEALRRDHFQAPDFTGTGYNEQQISEETERAKAEFAQNVYNEAYHQAVKPGQTEKEATIVDSEAYKELDQVNDELRIAVTEYLTDTQNGRIYGVQPYDVEVMMERLKEEKNMSPEERAVETLRREGNRLFDENTTVDNLNQAQRTQVEAQVHIEQNKGITSALDKLSKIEKERIESDKKGYDSLAVFSEIKESYEANVANKNQEKLDRRQNDITQRQNASNELSSENLDQVNIDYAVSSESASMGAHR